MAAAKAPKPSKDAKDMAARLGFSAPEDVALCAELLAHEEAIHRAEKKLADVAHQILDQLTAVKDSKADDVFLAIMKDRVDESTFCDIMDYYDEFEF